MKRPEISPNATVRVCQLAVRQCAGDDGAMNPRIPPESLPPDDPSHERLLDGMDNREIAHTLLEIARSRERRDCERLLCIRDLAQRGDSAGVLPIIEELLAERLRTVIEIQQEREGR